MLFLIEHIKKGKGDIMFNKNEELEKGKIFEYEGKEYKVLETLDFHETKEDENGNIKYIFKLVASSSEEENQNKWYEIYFEKSAEEMEFENKVLSTNFVKFGLNEIIEIVEISND